MQPIRSRVSRFVVLGVAAMLLLAGCGAGSSTGGPEADATRPLEAAQSVISTADGPCTDGRFVIGRLDEVQSAWDEGIAAATERARGWERDALLVEARLSCGFLSSEAVVKGTYYSDTARTLYFSYTGETTPVDPGVPAPPQLSSDTVSFTKLETALLDAGYSENAEVHPSSGVNVRYNGTTTPFGPASAPPETIIIHLTLVQDGMVQDVFIDSNTWQPISDS